MKAELIIPIDVLRGKLRKDGFYFRMYRGQQSFNNFARNINLVLISDFLMSIEDARLRM